MVKEGVEMEYPKCMKCEKGILVPLSDYGTDGASVLSPAHGGATVPSRM